jgi:antitoxin component of MazEF toxin-antitoxin module
MTQATIRNRRQLTLPPDICRELGLDVGDNVDLAVENGALIVTPSRRRALDALAEIQAAFERSEISERELLASARRTRAALTRKRYGGAAAS